jgi:hypothetical protein
MKVAPKGPTAKSGVTEEDPADPEEEELEDNASEVDDGEEPEDDAGEDDDPDADEEGAEEEGEDEPEAPATPAPTADDAVVKVVVNGEETEVTVGSLKRLAGQEATLTRKSQEADAVGGRAALLIQGALDTVSEDLEPYKDIDWLVAQQEMEPEEFKWHRENFSRNKARFDGLIKQAGEFEQVVAARAKAATAEQAREAQVELNADVPGWGDQLYGEIMSYAVSQGLAQEDVASIANAKVIKLLHKAMQHDNATAAVVKKVNATPARVKRPSGSDEAPAPGANSKQQRKLEQKMASGRATDDDAVALLMGRWKAK